LLGSFNPSIFQPEWFRRHELLPEVEVDAALKSNGQQRMVVSSTMTKVMFESLELVVTGDRWQLSTNREDWFDDLGPLVRSVFRLLRHTPLHAYGYNFHLHDSKEWSSVEANWLPLEHLRAVFGDSSLDRGGFARARWECFALTFRLERSAKVDGGTYLGQNFHREDLGVGVEDLLETTENWWSAALKERERLNTLVLSDRLADA